MSEKGTPSQKEGKDGKRRREVERGSGGESERERGGQMEREGW